MGDASGDSSASWQYIALQPDQDVLTGTIDIRDILHALHKAGLISGKDYVSGFELGAEVAGGAGSLTINGLHPTFAKYAVTSRGDTLTGTPENDYIDGRQGGDHLAGGDGSDRLIGGPGKDVLAGGLGSDRMTGGGGRDAFVFDSALGTNNVDRITDFSGSDTIRLSHVIFAAVGATLDATEFHAGARAADGDDHIIYDRATGTLSYDRDGAGGAGAGHVCGSREGAQAKPRGFRHFLSRWPTELPADEQIRRAMLWIPAGVYPRADRGPE